MDRKPGVVWFRRDLRLSDNPAWSAATAAHEDVVALFVLEPRLLNAAGVHRRNQLLAHLEGLDRQLKALGGGLTIRQGPAAEAVPEVLRESRGAGLYLNIDGGPFSTKRDGLVESLTVPVHRYHGNTVHEPGLVLTKKGTLSQVFTPFYKTWKATPLTPWPEPGNGTPIVIDSDPIPAPTEPAWQEGGEDAAWGRLQRWLDNVEGYPTQRDFPGVDGTSMLSADLKFGTVGARTILNVVGSATTERESFVRQLSWRDWWAHTLHQHPNMADTALRDDYNKIEWLDDEQGLEAWAAGQTGYPIVDAGMRQLRETGWMHNRVRMITASFLVKDLLIDWRKGERFFRHHLVDGDVAQNAGNWQWAAGTGPDAAPYFRIFNPTSQAAKFDPEGTYIKKWVPELSGLSSRQLFEPAEVPPLDLAAAGVILGDTYPAPIVDHKMARERTMTAYKKALG